MPPDSTQVPLGGTAAEGRLGELASHRVEAHRVVLVGPGRPRAPPPVAVPWPSRGRRRPAPPAARLAPREAALEDQLHVGAPAQPVAHAIEHGQVRVRRVPLRSGCGPGLEPRGRAPKGGRARSREARSRPRSGPRSCGPLPRGRARRPPRPRRRPPWRRRAAARPPPSGSGSPGPGRRRKARRSGRRRPTGRPAGAAAAIQGPAAAPARVTHRHSPRTPIVRAFCSWISLS